MHVLLKLIEASKKIAQNFGKKCSFWQIKASFRTIYFLVPVNGNNALFGVNN